MPFRPDLANQWIFLNAIPARLMNFIYENFLVFMHLFLVFYSFPQIISEKSIQSFFGLSHDQGNQDSESGYILFYQTRHTPLAETSQAYSNTADDDDGDDDTQSNAKDSNDAAAADKNNIPLGGIPSEDELEVAFTNGKLTSINNKPVCSDSTANSNGNTHAYHGTHV